MVATGEREDKQTLQWCRFLVCMIFENAMCNLEQCDSEICALQFGVA
jgi:hypothetical protein